MRVVTIADISIHCERLAALARSLDKLVGTLRPNVRGEVVCPPRTTSDMLHRVVDLIHQVLSHRELLGPLIEHSAVKKHVHNILEKVLVSRRAQKPALVGKGAS